MFPNMHNIGSYRAVGLSSPPAPPPPAGAAALYLPWSSLWYCSLWIGSFASQAASAVWVVWRYPALLSKHCHGRPIALAEKKGAAQDAGHKLEDPSMQPHLLRRIPIWELCSTTCPKDLEGDNSGHLQKRGTNRSPSTNTKRAGPNSHCIGVPFLQRCLKKETARSSMTEASQTPRKCLEVRHHSQPSFAHHLILQTCPQVPLPFAQSQTPLKRFGPFSEPTSDTSGFFTVFTVFTFASASQAESFLIAHGWTIPIKVH